MRQDGSEVPVDISLSPLETADGTFVSAAIRDITTTTKTLEGLRASNRDLHQFASIASHDLKAPSRHIPGFAELLQRDLQNADVDPGVQDLLTRMQNATQRMHEIIEDILRYSQAGENLTMAPTDLNELLDSVVTTLQPQIETTPPSMLSEISPPCRHRSWRRDRCSKIWCRTV